MKDYSISEEQKFNASDRAGGVLDHILNETSEVTLKQRANEVSVEDELRKERLIEDASSRVRSRVLFVTRNQKILEEDAPVRKHYKDLTEVFDEVHVIVLGVGKRKTTTIRLASKAWVYPTASKYFLQQPFAAYKTAKQQLNFTDGFRPDVVVALDPFESGIAGYFIAKRFKRSFQLHITEDFFYDTFEQEDESNPWRLRFAQYVLNRTQSVRVGTDTLREKVAAQYKNVSDLVLLPQYFNIKEIIESARSTQVEKLYPQFSFSILFVGVLDQDSTLFRALDAVRPLLRTPSIGFIVIGEGSAKAGFQERAKLLSIDSQVIFKPKIEDIVPHMRSVNLLICTDTDSQSETVAIQAAAAGLPAVLARTPLRDDLFTDGIDAYLCDPEDTVEFSQKMTKFLNINAMRTQFSQNAKDLVNTRIEEDPQMYRIALRDSIEATLYIEEATRQSQEEKLRKEEEAEIIKNEKVSDTTVPPPPPKPEAPDKQKISGIEMKMPKGR
jgi:glycosyltransferase involved in cell wall biosynthesis